MDLVDKWLLESFIHSGEESVAAARVSLADGNRDDAKKHLENCKLQADRIASLLAPRHIPMTMIQRKSFPMHTDHAKTVIDNIRFTRLVK